MARDPPRVPVQLDFRTYCTRGRFKGTESTGLRSFDSPTQCTISSDVTHFHVGTVQCVCRIWAHERLLFLCRLSANVCYGHTYNVQLTCVCACVFDCTVHKKSLFHVQPVYGVQ